MKIKLIIIYTLFSNLVTAQTKYLDGKLIEKIEYGNKFTYQYNKEGKIVLKKKYIDSFRSLRLYKKTKFTYNSNQKLIHRKETYHMTPETETVFEYKIVDGNDVEIITYKQGKLHEKEKRTYFKNGKVKQKRTIIYANKKINFINTLTYDDLGNITTNIYDDNHIKSKTYSKYNKYKLIEQEYSRLINDTINTYTFKKYNENDKIIEEISGQKNNPKINYYSHKTFTYNKKSKLVEEKILDEKGKLEKKITYSYNLLGKAKKFYLFNANNELIKTQKLRHGIFPRELKIDLDKFGLELGYKYKYNRNSSIGLSYKFIEDTSFFSTWGNVNVAYLTDFNNEHYIMGGITFSIIILEIGLNTSTKKDIEPTLGINLGNGAKINFGYNIAFEQKNNFTFGVSFAIGLCKKSKYYTLDFN